MPTVQCPHCLKAYRVADGSVGRIARCSNCGRSLTLRAAPAEVGGAPAQGARLEAELARADASREHPRKLGRFAIRSLLGSGAFGAVYRAYDPVLEREVALKVPHPWALESDEASGRLVREPRAAAQLRHPHIVPVYDAGFDGEHFFVASAFIEGRTLEEAIKREQFDVQRAASIVLKLADGLHYAHSQGVVHRDVKPSNIMLDGHGEPHLMDFGLARWEHVEEKLTQDGSLLGTPAYMSPEQAGAQVGDVGAASDQYSLGVVLYELLCGQRPFRREQSVAALLHQIRQKQPDSPRARNPRIDRDLETVCLKAMAKDPAARYPDCGRLADDLRRWLEGEPIRARRMSVAERTARWARHNRLLAALACAVAMLLVVVAVVATAASLRISKALTAMETALQREIAARRQADIERTRAERQEERARQQQVRTEQERKRADENAGKALREKDRADEKAVDALRERERAAAKAAEALREKDRAEEQKELAEKLRREAEQRERTVRRQLYAMQMDKAMQAFEAFHWDRLEQLLRSQVPEVGEEDLRTFEWRYLAGQLGFGGQPKSGASADVLHHGHAVRRLQFSAGGETLASFGQDMSVRFWDVAKGLAPKGVVTFPEKAIDAEKAASAAAAGPPMRDAFCLSADCSVLGMAMLRSGEAHFWRLDPRQEIVVGEKRPAIDCRGPVAISPDGRRLAAVRVVNEAGLAAALQPKAVEDAALELRLAKVPDEQMPLRTPTLASAKLEQMLRDALMEEGLDMAARSMRPSHELESNRCWATVVILDDHGRVHDRLPFVFGPGREEDRDWVRLLLFAPSGETLAIAHSDGSAGAITLWNLASRKSLSVAEGATFSPFDQWAFSPDGGKLAWLQFDRQERLRSPLAAPTVHVFETGQGRRLSRFPGAPGGNAITFGPDGRTAVMWRSISYYSTKDEQLDADTGKSVSIWDLETGRPTVTLEGHKFVVRSAAFAPDGKAIATASEDATIKLWDPAAGFERVTFHDHTDKVLSLAFSPDGSILAAGNVRGAIRLYKAVATPSVGLEKSKLAHNPQFAILSTVGLHIAGDDESAAGGAPAIVRVMKVLEDTPARRAGFRAGDRIVGVAGHPVRTLRDVLDGIRLGGEQGELPVQVDRDGRQRELLLVIGGDARRTAGTDAEDGSVSPAKPD